MAQIVEVEVVDIRAGGVLVTILPDGHTGFIRRRELSWERRLSFREEIPQKGQRFKALIVQEGKGGRHSQLSVRQLTDPWQIARNVYAVNDIVRGEVVNIRDYGVFVQLEPGIDAIIKERHIPLLRDQFPQEVLAVGDQVQGVLVHIDWAERQIELSLTHRLLQVSQDIGNGKFPQLALFRDKLEVWEGETAVNLPASAAQPVHSLPRRYHPPLSKLKRILIVDDHTPDRQRIARALNRYHKFEIDEAADSVEALAKLAKQPDYDLVIIDLTLQGETGLDVARKLLDQAPDLAILFTSNNQAVDPRQLVPYGRRYPFAVKERKELIAWVDKLYGGYWEEADRPNNPMVGEEGGFIRQLGLAAFTRQPLADNLNNLLARLRRESGVTQTMILEVDLARESAAIVAADPPLDDELLYETDALFYSPAQDVVEQKVVDYRKYVPAEPVERPSYLKNFFPLLPYQTYLGIPLTIPGMDTRHALFLLDEYRPTISDAVNEQANLAAQLIQVALERGLLLDLMHRYEQRYTLGQLLGSLIHELGNKLDALAGADNLVIQLRHATKEISEEEQAQWLGKSRKTAVRLARAKQDLQELILSYSRLASGNLEPVDINEVVRKVARQLEKRSQEGRVDLLVSQSSNWPKARAIQPRLEQVVANVILNAIQQIERHCRQMADIAAERGKTPLCQQGIVHIQTRHHPGAAYPLEIIVIDSGPGIAAHRQEEIFLLDTSGRKEGHGLGLYISRSLMETMGGRLSLADSVMFLGSAFVIALSEFPREGVDNG